MAVVSKHFDMPNGIVFSPNEKRLYVSGTGKFGKVLAFDVIAGKTLSEPVFELDIRSDGMCMDVRGNLYTTANGGIHIFSPKGEKLGLIPVDEQPANVCFGGKEFNELFITARKSLYHVPMLVAGNKKSRQHHWHSQHAFGHKPESVGVSLERLKRIDKLCEEAVSQGKVPGVVRAAKAQNDWRFGLGGVSWRGWHTPVRFNPLVPCSKTHLLRQLSWLQLPWLHQGHGRDVVRCGVVTCVRCGVVCHGMVWRAAIAGRHARCVPPRMIDARLARWHLVLHMLKV